MPSANLAANPSPHGPGPIPDRLRIVDVSQPAAPRELGAYPARGEHLTDVAVVEPYALLITWDPDRTGGPGRSTLYVVDVGDPTRPVERGAYPLPTVAWRLAVDGTRAYLAGESTVRALDISDPLQPQDRGWYELPGFIQSLAAYGDHMYVATGEAGLTILRFVGRD